MFILQRGRVVYFGDNGDAATTYFTQTLTEVIAVGCHDGTSAHEK